jgi:hypothetical protein
MTSRFRPVVGIFRKQESESIPSRFLLVLEILGKGKDGSA